MSFENGPGRVKKIFLFIPEAQNLHEQEIYPMMVYHMQLLKARKWNVLLYAFQHGL